MVVSVEVDARRPESAPVGIGNVLRSRLGEEGSGVRDRSTTWCMLALALKRHRLRVDANYMAAGCSDGSFLRSQGLRSGRLRAGAIGLVVAAAALSGCAGTSQSDASTRDETGAIVEEGAVGAFRIEVGDCLSGVGEGLIESANGVSCNTSHQYEVYHRYVFPEGDFPGTEVIETMAERECLQAFEGFVGVAYEESVYGFTALQPIEESWNKIDDREVLCMLGNYDGTDKTGSARGSGI